MDRLSLLAYVISLKIACVDLHRPCRDKTRPRDNENVSMLTSTGHEISTAPHKN